MKTKNLPKWKKKLTAAEREHIDHTTPSGTLAQFKRNREQQRKDKAIFNTEGCFECRFIAVKLGLED